MKIISIVTEKGGVGKTTTSIHLGASFSQIGKKVLLIDFDRQRNLSMGYKIPKDYPYNIKNFLDGTGEFRLKQKDENLLILPGSREISANNYKMRVLRDRLELLNTKIPLDYVIIDCPPSPLTGEKTLGEIALTSSDYVISPILAEEYSVEGINELLPSIWRIKEKQNPQLNFLGFFFNMALTNTRNFKEYRKKAKEQVSEYFFDIFIRQDVNVENAKKEGKTIFQIDDKSRASIDFKNLVKEINKKIENE